MPVEEDGENESRELVSTVEELIMQAGEFSGVMVVTAFYFTVYYCFLFTQSFNRIFLEMVRWFATWANLVD